MGDSSLTVREATAKDALAITEIHAAAWRQGYSHIFDHKVLERAISERRTRWTDLVAEPDFDQRFLIVAERDDDILGFAHFGPALDHPGDLEIYSFYAQPACWGTGLARDFMNSVLTRARTLGYERAYLSAYREAVRARRFYEIVGFKETGHTTKTSFHDNGEVFVVTNVEYVWDFE